MKKKRVLVCSAWPYASGIPHLGNLVSSLLSGDVFTRYYRMRGHDVLYVSGTDAHGTRIEYEAKLLGVSPRELAELNHERIVEVIKGFGILFDNYTTTESPVHRRFVRGIYLQMQEAGYITTAEEERAYCRNCRLFLSDRFISGTCPRCAAAGAMGNQCDACGTILEPEELVDPCCNFCNKGEIEFCLTRHWYLDLGRLSPALSDYVSSCSFQGNVRRFTEQMINDGLRPRAMTRDIEWGIPAPFDGAEGKVIYVWGEAALGYVSATIEHFHGDERWTDFWFGDDVHQVYTMGKDNITFHTLIFPGQLIASGCGYHLPDQIAATEYLNWIDGESFSKSRGVGIYCDDALAVMDGELWRFYLLYNRPEGRDVNFSYEELDKAVNGILISNLANLINRVLSFIQTRYDQVVPEGSIDPEVEEEVSLAVGAYEKAMEEGSLGRALRTVCSLAVFGNEYFQRKAPWKTGDGFAVGSAFHLVKGMAVLLVPFVPQFAARVLTVMGIEEAGFEVIEPSFSGRRIGDQRILLERIDVEQIEQRAQRTEQETVSFEQFADLDLRVGTIGSVEPIAGTDRLYRLTIDLGGETRTGVAGIRVDYTVDELVGRQVVVLANLAPTTIRGVESECMILAAKGEGLSLLRPDHEVPPGTPIG